MEKVSRFLLFTLALAMLLGACAPAVIPPTATPLPSASPTAQPAPTATAEPSVAVYYQEGSQFEIVTPIGRHIFIDPINQAKFTQKPTEQDILLVTHSHGDHFSRAIVDSFPGQKLIIEEGLIEYPDVVVHGIQAKHNETDDFRPKNGTDYIFLIETGQLRLAHFGDIGQDAFTDSQIETLGQLDVAMTQFENSFSRMTAENRKGFNLMKQLNPYIILQTHTSKNAADMAVKEWPALAAKKPVLLLRRSNIPSSTTLIFMGSLATANQKIYSLKWFGEP